MAKDKTGHRAREAEQATGPATGVRRALLWVGQYQIADAGRRAGEFIYWTASAADQHGARALIRQPRWVRVRTPSMHNSAAAPAAPPAAPGPAPAQSPPAPAPALAHHARRSSASASASPPRHVRSWPDPAASSSNRRCRIDPSIRLRRAIFRNDLLLVRRIVQNHPRVLRNPDQRVDSSLHLAAREGLVDVAVRRSCLPLSQSETGPRQAWSPGIAR